MRSGRARKQMIKYGRRVPIEEVRQFIHGRVGAPPQHYLLSSDGYELIRAWDPKHGFMELTMDNEAFAFACAEYLKSQGLVFDSDDAALRYAESNVFPKL